MQLSLKKQLTVLILLLQLTCWAAPELPANIPKDTLMVANIKVKEIKETPIIKGLLKLYVKEYENLKKGLKTGIGFDFDSIDNIWLVGKHFDECIMVIKGKFDIQEMQLKTGVNKDFEHIKTKQCPLAFYVPDGPDKKKNVAAVINHNTIAFGQADRIKSYMDQNGKKKSQLAKKEKKRLVRAFKKAPHFKAVFLAYPWPVEPGTRLILNHLDRGELNMKLENDLECAILLKAKTLKVTKTIKDIAHQTLIAGLAQTGNDKNEELLKSDISKYLKARTKKKNVILSSKITKKTIDSIIYDSMLNAIPKEQQKPTEAK